MGKITSDTVLSEPPSAAEACRRLGSDLSSGLDPAEAARRRQVHGPNELPSEPPTAWWHLLARQFVEPMAVLLLIAAGVAGFALGERVDAVAILAIVVLNALIGLSEEGRAARALEALRTMETTTAKVIRGGGMGIVPSTDVVPGDLIILSAGDRVPADLRLTETTGLQADESVLTGESLPLEKDADAIPVRDAAIGDRRYMAFTGTHVVGGSGRGVVVETGPRTVLGRIASELSAADSATPLQRELRALTARLGVIAVVVAGGVFGLTLVRTGLGSRSVEESFLAAVALAVAAVPEGLATVVTVALALGVRRMADRGVIIRRLPAVETLGATTVILTDKTGTLTQNRMQVAAIAIAGGPPRAPNALPTPVARRVAEVAVLCNDGSLRPEVVGDPVDVSLLEAFEPIADHGLRSQLPRIAAIPFDSIRSRMTTLHGADGHALLLTKGAPEIVLELSSSALHDDGSVRPLEDEERASILTRSDEQAESGMRMLAFAYRQLDGPRDIGEAEQQLVFAGLVGLRDPVRREASAAVADARSAGIHLIMVTGDHPGTASTIAAEVGLAAPRSPVVTGVELRREGLPEEPLSSPVYARVDPEQKLSLVEALRNRGQVVAVTGDGVNDAPALRRADIGVAMGKSGSDVAREAADMVVTDDDLASIVSAVREGRGIYDNIRKVVDYLVAGNLSEITVVVVSLLLFPALGVPLLPLQLLWINLLTDGLPALALGVDPPDDSLMRRPPRPAADRMLSLRRIGRLSGRGAIIAASAIGALAISRYIWNEPWTHARASMFSVLVVAHLLYAFVVRPRDPRGPLQRLTGNRALLLSVGLGIALQLLILAWPPARRLFDTAPLSPREWGLVVILGTVPAALMLLAQTLKRRQSGPSVAAG